MQENVVASNTGVVLKQKLPPDRMRRICRGEKLLMKGKPDEMNSTHIRVNKIIEYRTHMLFNCSNTQLVSKIGTFYRILCIFR